MKTVQELQILIIDWAREKNINNSDKQYLKIIEEAGETSRAILHNDIPELKDGLGDIAVTVIIYYWQKNKPLNLKEREYIFHDHLCFREIFKDLSEMNPDPLNLLEIIAYNHSTTLKECLNLAWNEIKDRKGKTVNGTFIKN
jgi:NTP pyrophosphatase (non-canonical NTP hydrolase)